MITPKIDSREMFSILVMQLKSSARTHLGMDRNPVTGKLEKNLDAAVLTVGILESLLFKTAGNLNKTESKLLETAVKELKRKLVKETDRQKNER